MADQKWTDYFHILNCIRGCETDLKNFQVRAEELHQIKTEVLDDQQRFDDLKLLVDLDPDLTMNDLADKYQYFKGVYDAIEEP